VRAVPRTSGTVGRVTGANARCAAGGGDSSAAAAAQSPTAASHTEDRRAVSMRGASARGRRVDGGIRRAAGVRTVSTVPRPDRFGKGNARAGSGTLWPRGPRQLTFGTLVQ